MSPRSRPLSPIRTPPLPLSPPFPPSAASPPTVSDTKNKFITSYSRPIPAIYGNIINELIVQQHIWRYNTAYQYDEVFALGVVSIFEQLMDGYDTTEREKIFAAYITALGENPEQYKRDAAAMEAAAAQLSGAGAASLMPGSDGVLGATTAKIASRIKEGKFFYTRFFAIGLFRLLELVGTKDPEALKSLVSAIGTRQDLVTKDLTLYKSILNRLQGAKELMKDFLERERRKVRGGAGSARVLILWSTVPLLAS